MTTMTKGALLAGLSFLAPISFAQAQEATGFSIEGELEFAIDSVVDADDSGAELTDTNMTAEAALTYRFSDTVSVFSTLVFETVEDPTGDRFFEDMGLYAEELGIALTFGEHEVAFGKLNPAFGVAWDLAPGYYGADFAEDYELAEQIGVRGTFAVGAGTLSAAVFYADDTKLSESLGINRGRNSSSDGGAGNTGELDNFAIDYAIESGNSAFNIGARYLSKGEGDAEDETGFVAGVTHALNDNLELLGEVAYFDGFGGADEEATYVTLAATYTAGNIGYYGSYTARDLQSAGTDDLLTVGVTYALANDVELGAHYAFKDEDDSESHSLAATVVIPFGF